MKFSKLITLDENIVNKAKEEGINLSGTINNVMEAYFAKEGKAAKEAFKKAMNRDMTKQEEEAFAILEKEDGRTINEFAQFIKFKESGKTTPNIQTPAYIEALKQTDTFKQCLALWQSAIGRAALIKSREIEIVKRGREINSDKSLYQGNQELYDKVINKRDETTNTNTEEMQDMREESKPE
jgi:post-segregation antitoxin (ccd killing protein)